MAIIRNNNLVEGLSGQLGKQLVFRTLYGKTVVSRMPQKPNKKKETEAQRNTRVNFRQATQWARRTLRDAEKKVYYQQRAKALKLPNAYTAAITDYMRKPKVEKSKQGNTLHYRIDKSGFPLKHVTATVTETNGVENARVETHRRNGHWFLQYKPDVNEATTIFALTITDNTGRSNVITTYG